MTAQPAGPAALEADGLCYTVDGGRYLVEGATLRLEPGTILALAGPNGAGKTTLLRMLCGLITPTSGVVRLFGTPLSALSDRDRARSIAYVGQIEKPDRRLTVHDYVALGRIPFRASTSARDDGEAVAAAMASVGISALSQTRIGHLSGGELQRAAMARALCQRPKILFLDEPTNHLDPRAKGELLSLVASRGITCVCVLHELALIPGLAGQTALLNRGRVEAVGGTGDVLTGERVRAVFGVDFLHVAHPTEPRLLPVLDIPVSHAKSNRGIMP